MPDLQSFLPESLSDRIHTIREKIKTLCLAPGFPTVERFAEVSCLHDDGDMDKLRKMIQEAIERSVSDHSDVNLV